VYKQVLRNLENVTSGQLSKDDVADAIIQVSQENNNPLSQMQTNALVNLIYKSSDVEETGFINRTQLKDGIIKNMDKLKVVTETSKPTTDPIIA
jgi:hypothetical protein